MSTSGRVGVTGVHRAAAVAEILLATGVPADGVRTGMGITHEQFDHLREVCDRETELVQAAHRQLTGEE
ncbi:hypothetical protein [Leucobacter aridicollis]|uniref:Uncharacterized protein n=1 Tax=Leucobacter aridicollis TaxID=283878 RepID=A0A852QX59_9MICO|nr:hypothetical protein [Leucobacter aridicollis]MBL3681991.1 hypothetical protein [Leucobacter aridicollis]NYD26963.1 hypothetical protein [Leucobacter aridicollis]